MRRSGHNAKLVAVGPAYRRKKMRKFLLYSSALMVSGLLSGAAEAACIQTPTCSSLGYTSSSSCTGGIKCPFGNAWNCTLINKITEIEKKVTEIINNGGGSSGSNTNNDFSSCKIGDILYSDFSCNSNIIANKTPIAVIFDTTNTLAVSLSQSAGVVWGPTDVTGVNGVSNINTDFNGKKNTQLIIDYCEENNTETTIVHCAAFDYIKDYKTEGTKAGDWYMPATGELLLLTANYETVNKGLEKVGGTKLENVTPPSSYSESLYYTYIWTSSITENRKNVYACGAPSICINTGATYDSNRFYITDNIYLIWTFVARPIINYKEASGL